MVEALIALPLLLLALSAVPYLHALLAAHQDTFAEARRAAWTAALDGCNGDARSAPDATVKNFLNELPERALDIPVIGTQLAHFMPRALGETSNREVRRPNVLAVGDEQDFVHGRVDLVCNEPTRSARDSALDLLWALLAIQH